MPITLTHKALAATVFALLLGACSSSGVRPKPAPLPEVVPSVSAQQVWVNRVGEGGTGLLPASRGGQIAAASQDGALVVLNAATGADVWRLALGERLSAGVGFDGRVVSVVTDRNDLLAVVEGRVAWRQRLPFASFTPPVVAGERVFVLGADRSVAAFDGATGARLWLQSRPGEALSLKQAGVLMPFGDTLLAGLGGRLAALNPDNGSLRWDVALASPRGANDVERMIDLVAPAHRQGNQVCVRAFQAAVGCVDATQGRLMWTQPADGRWGPHGNERQVVGVENNGTVVSYALGTGEKAWSTSVLAHRNLSAPLLLGRSVVVGDGMGFVHLLSREDGNPQGRLSTDGSALAAPPFAVGDTLVAYTQKGQMFAWRPQ